MTGLDVVISKICDSINWEKWAWPINIILNSTLDLFSINACKYLITTSNQGVTDEWSTSKHRRDWYLT